MTKDLLMKDQQIMVVEDALSRKKGNRNGGKGVAWPLESLFNHGIARYHGICFAGGKYGSNLPKLVVTESYIDDKGNGNQKKDWSASDIRISNETAARANICIKLPDGVC